ncbi:glycoside hydrolase family 30 [Pelomyxa schiedti]|nr:glycoside hydrolase family 30 [Pelomyxa schiedti]
MRCALAVLLWLFCGASAVEVWLTTPDQSVLFQKQDVTSRLPPAASSVSVDVDPSSRFQVMSGFGWAMTCGSAGLLASLPDAQRASLLRELFADVGGVGSNETGVASAFLRVNLGACDMCAEPYTYDDVAGDVALAHFSVAGRENATLMPVLAEIVGIRPGIELLATPWSAPAWMKSNNAFIGGSLLTEYYQVYANYFVKYFEEMADAGITITGITPQNEPLYGGNNPSMVMSADEETVFIRDYLGPTMKAAGGPSLGVKILTYDHNCDEPGYPETVLSDSGAYSYVSGSAYHLYAGDVSAMSEVHNMFPAKDIYFTEQYTPAPGNFTGDFMWGVQNLIVGASQNWARSVLLWNLAADPDNGPHTVGGCDVCLPAITIDLQSNGADAIITRNVQYYIVAHASRFVQPGWYHVSSTDVTSKSISNIAFYDTASGHCAVVLANSASKDQTVTVTMKSSTIITTTVPAGAVVTVAW